MIQDQNNSDNHIQIEKHLKVFNDLLSQADSYLTSGRVDVAGVYAEIAANYAMCRHVGLFMSPQLEQILLTIGEKIKVKTGRPRNSIPQDGYPRRVLHVLTRAGGIGGDTRLVWRWVKQDTTRSHSIVLTRQGGSKIPPALQGAISSTGGKITVLNEHSGNFLTWAKKLRELASEFDIVVLHIHPYDIIPTLAFADKKNTPPVVFIDHADQVFWVGASVSDLVVNLRISGMQLAQKRRGIPKERLLLLPTSLGLIDRSLTRLQAKKLLGLPEDSIVILSIARPHKYMTMDNQNFAAIHTPVLEKYKKAILLVVGPDESDEWKIENKKTNGRVLAFGKREDTAIFYEAADIYVDSYPINSITSLLEAGCYGLPLISRCPYPEESAVLCADAPGLTNRLIITRNLQEYHSRLSHLIENEKYRLDLGEETRQSISSLHGGALWNQSLNALYHQASNTPPLEWAIAKHDESLVDGLDFSLSQLQKDEPGLDDILKFHLRILPLDLRMRGWVDVVQKKHTFLPGLLLPEWIGSRFERWLQA